MVARTGTDRHGRTRTGRDGWGRVGGGRENGRKDGKAGGFAGPSPPAPLPRERGEQRRQGGNHGRQVRQGGWGRTRTGIGGKGRQGRQGRQGGHGRGTDLHSGGDRVQGGSGGGAPTGVVPFLERGQSGFQGEEGFSPWCSLRRTSASRLSSPADGPKVRSSFGFFPEVGII